jgi:hypothetical protein
VLPPPCAGATAPCDVLHMDVVEVRPSSSSTSAGSTCPSIAMLPWVVENANVLRREAVDERAGLGSRGSDRAGRGLDDQCDPVGRGELGRAGEAVTRAFACARTIRRREDAHLRRPELRGERGERTQSCRRGQRRRPALDADARGVDVNAAKSAGRRARRFERLPGPDPLLHRAEPRCAGRMGHACGLPTGKSGAEEAELQGASVLLHFTR